MRRFPLRTVLLMIFALVAFGRFWCMTHPADEPEGQGGVFEVTVQPQTPTADAGP